MLHLKRCLVNSSTLKSNWWYCIRIGVAQLALVADCVADVCAADTSSSDEAVIDFMVLDGEVIFIATPPILLQTNRRIESVEAANTVLVFKINDARVGLSVDSSAKLSQCSR